MQYASLSRSSLGLASRHVYARRVRGKQEHQYEAEEPAHDMTGEGGHHFMSAADSAGAYQGESCVGEGGGGELKMNRSSSYPVRQTTTFRLPAPFSAHAFFAMSVHLRLSLSHPRSSEWSEADTILRSRSAIFQGNVPGGDPPSRSPRAVPKAPIVHELSCTARDFIIH